jgi:hypothetical protein
MRSHVDLSARHPQPTPGFLLDPATLYISEVPTVNNSFYRVGGGGTALYFADWLGLIRATASYTGAPLASGVAMARFGEYYALAGQYHGYGGRITRWAIQVDSAISVDGKQVGSIELEGLTKKAQKLEDKHIESWVSSYATHASRTFSIITRVPPCNSTGQSPKNGAFVGLGDHAADTATGPKAAERFLVPPQGGPLSPLLSNLVLDEVKRHRFAHRRQVFRQGHELGAFAVRSALRD